MSGVHTYAFEETDEDGTLWDDYLHDLYESHWSNDCGYTYQSIVRPGDDGDYDDYQEEDFWGEQDVYWEDLDESCEPERDVVPRWYVWDELVGRTGEQVRQRMGKRRPPGRRIRKSWKNFWKGRPHRLAQWDRGPERDTVGRRRDARRGYYFYNQHD